ncbi:MAG: thioredoxin fold domain-containing protein [Gammaproteobacteria bacterium]|nr:thioredoxin fold domain-containing protein [Gammaproteobacteria bacterium]MBL6998423.1 thioredoxin fold domain-containing protein [Gammaproteobacteria bacterium]
MTIVVWVLLFNVQADTSPQGRYLGAKTAQSPLWLKDSFLEFEEDIAEAAAKNKRVMIYFHQDGCPYCARLVEENFADPVLGNYIQKHFDAIEINMWGDRQIVSIGGKPFTEKTFAAALQVQYTPTILFLNEQGKTALRLNGYYPSDKFRLALRYAAEKLENKLSFNEFVRSQSELATGPLIDEDFFLRSTNLQQQLASGSRYLAVYFESPGCAECKVLHERVLSDKPTRELVKKMDSVQLNIYSDTPLVAPDGTPLSQSDFARKLNIGYTPSVVFYNAQGIEVHRIDGFLKTFHFQSSLAYVLEGAYQTQPSFQRYISARGESLREQGFDTDIWGYDSSFPAHVAQ